MGAALAWSGAEQLGWSARRTREEGRNMLRPYKNNQGNSPPAGGERARENDGMHNAYVHRAAGGSCSPGIPTKER
jgi:hypothetical protein